MLDTEKPKSQSNIDFNSNKIKKRKKSELNKREKWTSDGFKCNRPKMLSRFVKAEPEKLKLLIRKDFSWRRRNIKRKWGLNQRVWEEYRSSKLNPMRVPISDLKLRFQVLLNLESNQDPLTATIHKLTLPTKALLHKSSKLGNKKKSKPFPKLNFSKSRYSKCKDNWWKGSNWFLTRWARWSRE